MFEFEETEQQLQQAIVSGRFDDELEQAGAELRAMTPEELSDWFGGGVLHTSRPVEVAA